jgi:regulation of enolase protein 1 (concanavalin A-like superfamily)
MVASTTRIRVSPHVWVAVACGILVSCAPRAANRIAQAPDAGDAGPGGGAGGSPTPEGAGGNPEIGGPGDSGQSGGGGGASPQTGDGAAGTAGTGGTDGGDAAIDTTPAPPAAPTGVVATAGDTRVRLTWAPVPGATSYNVKRATTAAGPYATLLSHTNSLVVIDAGVSNGTVYYYVISANIRLVEGPNSAVVRAMPIAPPEQWMDQDVGKVDVAGSARQNGTAFTVAGAGDDIYDTADAFHYVFQQVSGDATIVARVLSIQKIDDWSKAAVMMRDGLAAGAVNVALVTSPVPANNYRVQTRTTADATTSSDKAGEAINPVWLRLVRRASTFTASTSTDGMTWTPSGSPRTITMPASITVGLAVSSHTAGTAATAMFENVSLTTP